MPIPFLLSRTEPDADEAFRQAVEHDHLHHPTRERPPTISTKHHYVVVRDTPLEHTHARDLAEKLLADLDPRVEPPDAPAGAIPFGTPTILTTRTLRLRLDLSVLHEAGGDERSAIIAHANLEADEQVVDYHLSHGRGGEDGFTVFDLMVERQAPPTTIEGWVFFGFTSDPPHGEGSEA